MSAEAPNPLLAKIDLHGYRPAYFIGQPMAAIVQQAWEMGTAQLRFVHGHGRTRGKSPGFYNTHTGYFDLRLRRELRHNRLLRQWIKYTSLMVPCQKSVPENDGHDAWAVSISRAA